MSSGPLTWRRARVACAVAVLGPWTTAPALADDEAPRRIDLVGSLPLDGQLLATEASGFRVRVRQGEVLVPFELVDELGGPGVSPPRDQVWTVLLSADSDPLAADVATAALQARRGFEVQAVDTVRGVDFSADPRACGADVTCLAEAHTGDGWVFFLHADRRDGVLSFTGRHTTLAALQGEGSAAPDDATALFAAVGAGLGLQSADTSAPEAFMPAVEALSAGIALERDRQALEAWTPRRVASWSFVPVPGLPSLLQEDYGAFAGALAVVAGSTAAWVGATGRSSTTRGEHIALGVAGSYALTVASSQLFGQLSRRRNRRALSVAVAPMATPRSVDGSAGPRATGAAFTLSWQGR